MVQQRYIEIGIVQLSGWVGDTYRSRACGPALAESVPLGNALPESCPPWDNRDQREPPDAKNAESIAKTVVCIYLKTLKALPKTSHGF